MDVKTDMSKAYDRIEWDFIKTVLERFGFHNKWVNWIMQCVTTISYSFLLNGTAKEAITPTRGIRQETPYHPTYSSYVVKSYLVYAKKPIKMEAYQELEWRETALE